MAGEQMETDVLEGWGLLSEDAIWEALPEARQKPRRTAAAAAFLASPAASYINGINVPVDGGRTGSL